MINFEKYKDQIKEFDCGFNFKINKTNWKLEKCNPPDCTDCFFALKK